MLTSTNTKVKPIKMIQYVTGNATSRETYAILKKIWQLKAKIDKNLVISG